VDYPCGKFDDDFSRCGSIVRTDTQTVADERYTPATLDRRRDDSITLSSARNHRYSITVY